MSIKNRAISLFLAVIMTVSLAVTASAVVPDFTKTGTINILLTDNGKPVSGGTLTIYRVADVHEDDGNYSFMLTDEFAGSEESLENIGSYSLANRLAEYADENKIDGDETKTIGRDGSISFDNLELGLYLLVQYKAAYGYYKLNSFLVSVPQIEGDEYVYTVDASPKVEAVDKPTITPPPGTETETEPDETEPETEPKETEPETEPDETEPKETEPDETEPKETEPEESEPKETEPEESEPKETEPEESEPKESESEPEETELDDIGDLGFPELPADEPEETELEDIGDLGFPELPATGQLKWPIPVLVIGGLTLFLIGWVLRFRKKDQNEE